MYSEVASPGSFLAKDKNVEVVFIQNKLLISFIYCLQEPYLNIRLIIVMSRFFLSLPSFSSLFPSEGRIKNEISI
jgi:hypothetical protein